MEGVIFAPRYEAVKMVYNTGESLVSTADSTAVFEMTFKEHYKGLHAYACTLVSDEDEAEEIVQNVFCKLWEKNRDLKGLDSVAAYLYRSVYNEGINFLRHQKVKANYQAHALRQGDGNHSNSNQKSVTELEARIQAALNELPEKCRTVFQMSRFEEMKYHEIAAKLELSVKTVENHMGKALRLMREKLADYLPIVWILLLNF